MVCPNCGNKIKRRGKFCCKCGTLITVENRGVEAENELKADKNHTPYAQSAKSYIADENHKKKKRAFSQKGKKGKSCKKWLLVTVPVFLLLVLTGVILIAAYVMGNGESAELTTVSETEYMMYLSADQTDFSVNETAIVTLTVHTPDDDSVSIYDEDDNCLATLSSENEDEDGNWSVELDITSDEDRVLSLTARSDVGSSVPLKLYVTSPITGVMVQECTDILDELVEYLGEEGYETQEEYDADALELAANWLELDDRVAAVSRNDTMTLFVTNNHVTGACTLPSEEGTFGTSDGDYESYQTKSIAANLYKLWNGGIDIWESGYYVNSYNTSTNNNVLILSPLYNSTYKDEKGNAAYSEIVRSYNNYIDVLSKYGEGYLEGGQKTEAIGEDAIKFLISSDAEYMSYYGIIIFNTHGAYMTRSDGTKRLKTMLWTYDKSKFDDMLSEETIRVGDEEVSNQYLYGETEYATSRLALTTDDGIIATSEFYMDKWQNIEFDNTVFYFGICFGLVDDLFNDFLISHGAVAVIGYTQTIDSNVERMRFESFFSSLLSEGDDQAYYTIAEATTSNYGVINGISTGIFRLLQPYFKPQNRGNQKMYVYSARDDFTLYGYGKLSGQVELSEIAEELEENFLVEGATVTAYRYLNKSFTQMETTTVKEDGTFEFDNLEYGVYAITVEKDEFRTSVTSIVYENMSQDGDTIYLTPDTNLVKGIVLDDGTGQPVAGATVVCSGDNGSSMTASTNEEGVYKLKKLEVGEYTVKASAEGYYSSETSKFTVEEDSLLITPEVLYVSAPIEVNGHVVDSETGETIEGATVQFRTSEENVEVTTDAGGAFTVTIAPGSCRITVTKADYEEGTFTAVLIAGENKAIELEIEPIVEEESTSASEGIPSDALLWNGHHYYFFDLYLTWDEAEAYCESLGGHLVTITSQEEQEAVFNYLVSAVGDESNVLIGLSDADNEGDWSTWVTGEPVTYTNWGRGEPDNWGGVQHYGLMTLGYVGSDYASFSLSPGQWDDNYTSDTTERFLCEWDY